MRSSFGIKKWDFGWIIGVGFDSCIERVGFSGWCG
jgi:hypothetical protein